MLRAVRLRIRRLRRSRVRFVYSVARLLWSCSVCGLRPVVVAVVPPCSCCPLRAFRPPSFAALGAVQMRPLSRLAYLGAVLTACAVPPTDNPDLMTPPTGEVCPYEKAPLPSGIGERIMPGQVLAGTAESRIDLPVGTPLGGFTSRMKALGGHSPDDPRSPPAKAFVPSAGVQTLSLIQISEPTRPD